MSLPFKWVQLVSVSQLKLGNPPDFPPLSLGKIENFETEAENWKTWTSEFRTRLDQWYEEFGLVRKPTFNWLQPSPYFNVCLYPKPLNYFEAEQQQEGRWIQLSSTILSRKVNAFIEQQGWTNESDAVGREILTEEFLRRPGRLVLVR